MGRWLLCVHLILHSATSILRVVPVRSIGQQRLPLEKVTEAAQEGHETAERSRGESITIAT